MNRRMIFLAVLILVLPAAYFGYRLGEVPSEAKIIESYAETYVAEAGPGAQVTDCRARPHDDPAIRMVITCTAPDGSNAIFYAGPRGRPVPPPVGPDA